jgi:hypothetical protein
MPIVKHLIDGNRTFIDLSFRRKMRSCLTVHNESMAGIEAVNRSIISQAAPVHVVIANGGWIIDRS